jgi:hypothetical protein
MLLPASLALALHRARIGIEDTTLAAMLALDVDARGLNDLKPILCGVVWVTHRKFGRHRGPLEVEL